METSEYEIMFRTEDTHWWYQALHDLVFAELKRALPLWPEKKILDAGCGTGAVLAKLGNPERNHGIDLSSEAIKFCHSRGLLNVMQADVAKMPFSDETFDAVICSSVLYHRWVRNVPAALQELRRVLKPGGLLLVNLPAHSFLHSKHDDLVFTARRFTRKETRDLLKAAGFNVVRINYWTTFLFPIAYLARTFRLSANGRDFGTETAGSSLRNNAMKPLMRLERCLFSRLPMPFGVALFATAERT